ncbi:MAG: histidine kinase [Acidobacteria bacterium]|nr:MAG: histidine kinase [Acidobacteriota bacterium]
MPAASHRGTLKLLLGYAVGVGKTCRMLEEAQGLKQQGVDVVIGYFEPHGRKDTIEKTRGLETIPRRKLQYRGSAFEEMDTESILARRPQVCVVDEFAHTNVPGSERAKRWEDVHVLLDSGINVLTNMNVQHLESLNDTVWQFTGVRVRETIPDWVVKQADEVVMVDLLPQALLNRLKRGAVYPEHKAQQALENFFKEPNLVALRELALRQAAHEIDIRHEPPAGPGIQRADSAADRTSSPLSAARPSDRLLIHITGDPSTAALIRRGRRVADFLHAECYAVFVHTVSDFDHLPAPERQTVEKHLNFARNLQIETRVLQGEQVAQALVEFARRHGITQIFLLRPRPTTWPVMLGRNLVQKVVDLARDMQVTIVAERRRG